MRVVVPAVIIMAGLYAFALYGPMPFTTEGLLLGVGFVAAVLLLAIFAWDRLS